jgi:hypothetical protein
MQFECYEYSVCMSSVSFSIIWQDIIHERDTVIPIVAKHMARKQSELLVDTDIHGFKNQHLFREFPGKVAEVQ